MVISVCFKNVYISVRGHYAECVSSKKSHQVNDKLYCAVVMILDRMAFYYILVLFCVYLSYM